MYLPLEIFAGPILIFFLDLMYFMAKSMTMTATTDKMMMATKSPLQRIFWSRVLELLHIHVNELLSLSQGSVDFPISAPAGTKIEQVKYGKKICYLA